MIRLTGVGLSELIWFARVSSHVSDVNTCNKIFHSETSQTKLSQTQ